jgi:ATP adenylyltransferase
LFQDSVGTIPSFPFLHAIASINPNGTESPLEAASESLDCYHTLLQAVGLLGDTKGNSSQQKGAYNLLATRQWMLLVPRSLEYFESIPVNSLGFAGTLAVRSEQQMKILKEQGPMTVLRSVAVPTAL